jgi:hypothetical protein
MRARFILFALPVTWVACFSNSSGGGGGGASFDASADSPEFDSSMPDSAPAEAGEEAAADAPVDTAMIVEAATDSGADVVDAPPDVGPAPITVAVVGFKGPEQGVTVVYGDATGAVQTTATTNAMGLAMTVLPAKNMVTVVLGTPSTPSLFTAIDVPPGATFVVVDQPPSSTLFNQFASLDAIPTTPVLTGVSSYQVMTGRVSGWNGMLPGTFWLGGNPSSIGIGTFGSTVGAAFPMLVEADDATGNLLGYAFSKVNGLSMLDDAGYADVAITGSWATAGTNQLVAVTQPDGGSIIPNLLYSEVADGVLIPQTPRASVDAGGEPLFVTHPGFADFVQGEASSVSGNGATATATRGKAPTKDGTMTLDLSGFPGAPAITGANATASAAGQPSVSWTLGSGTLASQTAVLAMMNWSALVDGGSQNGTWTLIAPGTSAASVTGPLLPSGSGFAPATTGLNVSSFFAIAGQTSMPTYGAVLPIMSTLYGQSACFTTPYFPALPGDGTAQLAPGGC